MKPFIFSLERLREYRNQVLDTEKSVLTALFQRLYDIEDKIELSRNFRKVKQEEMRRMQELGSTMKDLEECKFYLENTRRRLDALEEERVRAVLEVERQRKVVLKASQDVSSLDKLEEKQLEDYHYLEARDNEKTIQEHVIQSIMYPRQSIS